MKIKLTNNLFTSAVLIGVLKLSFLISVVSLPAWSGSKVSNPKATQPTLNQPSTDSIWTNISKDFKLDTRSDTPQVKKEIRMLLADRPKFNRILQASSPYIYYIHQATVAKGLPAEIALVPFVESEFNPNDYSTRGATGLWQLIPGTARELGISVRSGYDGRKNIVTSTNAALAYFRDLGRGFHGNWYLAFAAYNCGQGRIAYAQRYGNSNYFWNLPMPRETKSYVARLLAVAQIIKNPAKYGVQLPAIKNQPFFTEVNSKKATTLAQLSKTTGVNMDILRKLNPDYKYGIVPKKDGLYHFLVPVDKPFNVNL